MGRTLRAQLKRFAGDTLLAGRPMPFELIGDEAIMTFGDARAGVAVRLRLRDAAPGRLWLEVIPPPAPRALLPGSIEVEVRAAPKPARRRVRR